MKYFPKILILFVIFLLTLTLGACIASNQPIKISQSWARAAAEGNSACYFIVESRGSEDYLLSADSNIAARIEIHRSMMMEDDMMKMEKIERLELLPEVPVVFEPGGYHIMLIDLHAPLVAGEEFQVTLQFENAGEIKINVPIKNP
jgi:periplasmic copper chaperone A